MRILQPYTNVTAECFFHNFPVGMQVSQLYTNLSQVTVLFHSYAQASKQNSKPARVHQSAETVSDPPKHELQNTRLQASAAAAMIYHNCTLTSRNRFQASVTVECSFFTTRLQEQEHTNQQLSQ